MHLTTRSRLLARERSDTRGAGVKMMALPPYPGQGRALSSGSYEGQWVIEGKVFICRLPAQHSEIEFVRLEGPNGEIADGFNADILAGYLEITTEQLFDKNRRCLLMVEYFVILSASGVETTTRYDFRMPHASIQLNVLGPQ
jgi:hypothetical protein